MKRYPDGSFHITWLDMVRRKPLALPATPIGQAPVPGGLMGMAGVEPSGTVFKEFVDVRYSPSKEPMTTDADRDALRLKIERSVQGWSVVSAIAGFGLGGIVGTLRLGVLAGMALSVFCAALAYVAFLLVAWGKPTLFVPKS